MRDKDVIKSTSVTLAPAGKEGLFKQTSNPIPFTGTDGKTWYYIDFVELGKPLK